MIRFILLLFSASLLSIPALAQNFGIGFSFQDFFDEERNREVPVAVYYPSNSSGENVPVASSQAGFPILSFGHGFVIDTESYSWLWEALVPEGYILVFPRTEGQLLPAPDHNNFGLDIAFAANELIRLSELPSGPLSGKVYPRVAYMGHSMGGGATYLGATQSDQVHTTITFAASETNPSAIDAALATDVPSLVIAAVEDCVTPISSNQQPMYDNLSAVEKAIVSINGASHCNFTDGSANLCYLGEGFSCFGFGPFISIEEQHERSLELILPWIDRFLKRDCSAGELFASVLDDGNSEAWWSFDWTGTSSFECPASCEAPEDLDFTGDAESGFHLSWTENPFALGYQYRVRLAGGGASITELSPVAEASLSPLPGNQQYEYRVRSFCPGFGFGPWSDYLPLNSGTEQASLELELQGSELFISKNRNDPGLADIYVYGVDGRLLHREQQPLLPQKKWAAQSSLNGFASGVYIVVVDAGELGTSQLKVAFHQ